MLSQLFTEHWAAVTLVILAISFNMYAMAAEKGTYPMGWLIYKYRAAFEAVNWLLYSGLIVYLSYLYSWYLLISLFLLPGVGASIASLLKQRTAVIYILALPVFLIIFVIELTN